MKKPKSEMDLDTAKRCADTIREYWLSKGAKVKVWVEPISLRVNQRMSERSYTVKSEGIPGVS